MNEKPAIISVSIPQEDKERYEKVADERGISMSAFIKESLDICTSFDKGFINMVRDISRKLNVPISMLIKTWVIRRAVELEIKNEIFGGGELLEEFQFTSTGPISGLELVENLKSVFKHKYEAEKRLSQENIDKYLKSQ